MDRCGSFPLLSAPHSLFSIWTDLKRSEKIPGAPTWSWGEWIWLTGSSGVHRNSPQGLNIGSIRVFDQIRDPEIPITLRPHLCYKEPKRPYNSFLMLIFNELFKFKTSDEWQHWKTGIGSSSISCLRSHTDPCAFFTALPRLSDQKISM